MVEINGLLWDRGDLRIEGRSFFTWSEALDAASSVSKRLPTRSEFERLIQSGSATTSHGGVWLGADSELLARSKKSIFIPFDGAGTNAGRLATSSGQVGYLWSSTESAGGGAFNLTVRDGQTYVESNNQEFLFSVRCVRDAPSGARTVTDAATYDSVEDFLSSIDDETVVWGDVTDTLYTLVDRIVASADGALRSPDLQKFVSPSRFSRAAKEFIRTFYPGLPESDQESIYNSVLRGRTILKGFVEDSVPSKLQAVKDASSSAKWDFVSDDLAAETIIEEMADYFGEDDLDGFADELISKYDLAWDNYFRR